MGRLFRQIKQLGIEVLYLTLAVTVGFVVLGYLTRTGAFTSIETLPGIGMVARGAKAAVYQVYNP